MAVITSYSIHYTKLYDEKECLCVGLGISALQSKGIEVKESDKVTVCPGPNLAYFSKKSTLTEMVDHIYGRTNLLDDRHRPHMFIKEFGMYLDILKDKLAELAINEDAKARKNLVGFVKNMTDGVAYYQSISSSLEPAFASDLATMNQELIKLSAEAIN